VTAVRYENPPGQPPPVGQYSNVAVVPAGGEAAYVAGQLPVDDSGEVVAPDDFDSQADLVFQRLAETLEAVGSSLAKVVYLRAYLVRDEDFSRFRHARQRAYRNRVPEPPPATTLVGSGLYGGARIELDAVAAL
jgi:2-iminobutanoate/2-iminopropanoate deaminase